MIKSILGGKSKNLCDVAYLLTLPLDKKFNGYGFWEVEISVEPNTVYTFSRENANLINVGDATYLGITNQYGIPNGASPNQWLNHETLPGLCHQNVQITSNAEGKLWVFFSSPVYNYWQKNLNPFGYIQLEKGSTATEYVPHELTSYKSIMKMSDVCQLVDKSKFTASGTQNGITWVSNGDGSITLNGTCTSGFALNPFNQSIPVDQTHFYYSSPYVSINYGGVIDGKYATGIIGYVKSSTFPTKFNTVFYIWIAEGKSFSNVTTFINIDDLTEMFGAGNEPKTVAEFKAKFPNDYYPYSPSCFVTSFDERMPCKTKNLFNYKNSDSTAKTITSNGVTLSLKNDYFELYGTQQEDKYFECSLTQFNIPFTAGKTYILSLDNAIPQLSVVYFNGFYNNDTKKQLNLLRVQGTNNNPLQTFTPTKDGYFSQIVVYSPKSLRFSGNYNMRVQIEENSRKTEYVPHNYV